MVRRIVLALLTAAPLSAGGCTSETPGPPPAELLGTYSYLGRGQVADLPWSVEASLDLYVDSRYILRVLASFKGDEERETDSGTFYLAGNRLILESEEDPDEMHEFILRADTLFPDMDWHGRLTLRALGVTRPAFVKERGTAP